MVWVPGTLGEKEEGKVVPSVCSEKNRCLDLRR